MRTKAGKIPPFEIYRDRGRIAAELRMVLGNLVNGRAPWPLYLHGQPGRGKTCAGLALCDWADWAMYCTVRKLCNQIMRKDEAVCHGLSTLGCLGRDRGTGADGRPGLRSRQTVRRLARAEGWACGGLHQQLAAGSDSGRVRRQDREPHPVRHLV